MATTKQFDIKLLTSKVIICDVEGTTTSISFVKEKLFPYVRENVAAYLRDNWTEDAVKATVALLREQAQKDIDAKLDGTVAILDEAAGTQDAQIESIVKNVIWQMDGDRKTSALKALQGQIWTTAYETGKIHGDVFSDVQKSFTKWTASGRKIYIYSSGSVLAQKLLFKHSVAGDLAALLAGHFDLQVGSKLDKSSYAKIVETVNSPPESIVFFTDIALEGIAARSAGMNVVLVKRPGNAELDNCDFPVIESFFDVPFEGCMTVEKRKVVDEDEEEGGDDVVEKEEPPTKIARVDNSAVTDASSSAATVTVTAEAVPKKKLNSDEKVTTSATDGPALITGDRDKDMKMDVTVDEATPKTDNAAKAAVAVVVAAPATKAAAAAPAPSAAVAAVIVAAVVEPKTGTDTEDTNQKTKAKTDDENTNNKTDDKASKKTDVGGDQENKVSGNGDGMIDDDEKMEVDSVSATLVADSSVALDVTEKKPEKKAEDVGAKPEIVAESTKTAPASNEAATATTTTTTKTNEKPEPNAIAKENTVTADAEPKPMVTTTTTSTEAVASTAKVGESAAQSAPSSGSVTAKIEVAAVKDKDVEPDKKKVAIASATMTAAANNESAARLVAADGLNNNSTDAGACEGGAVMELANGAGNTAAAATTTTTEIVEKGKDKNNIDTPPAPIAVVNGHTKKESDTKSDILPIEQDNKVTNTSTPAGETNAKEQNGNAVASVAVIAGEAVAAGAATTTAPASDNCSRTKETGADVTATVTTTDSVGNSSADVENGATVNGNDSDKENDSMKVSANGGGSGSASSSTSSSITTTTNTSNNSGGNGVGGGGGGGDDTAKDMVTSSGTAVTPSADIPTNNTAASTPTEPMLVKKCIESVAAAAKSPIPPTVEAES